MLESRDRELLLTPPMDNVPNVVLLDKVLEQIDIARNNPQAPFQWDQGNWRMVKECGTSFCFAGWAAQLDSADWLDRGNGLNGPSWVNTPTPDEPRKITHVSDYAKNLLGLDDHEAEILFAGDNTYEHLVEIVSLIKARHNLL